MRELPMNHTSFATCNQAGIEFVISTDENLKEHVLFLSDIFPVAMYTQHYNQAASDFIPLHWHDELQIVWVSEGELIYSVNRDTFELDSSRLLFLSGRHLHSSKPHSQDTKTLCINFSSSVFHPLILEHCLTPIFENPSFSYAVFPLKPYQILKLKEFLIWEHEATGYFSIINFISQILEEILKNFKEDAHPANLEEMELFQRILAYLHEHYSEPLTVKDISGYALVNKNKLTELFKKYTNMSPMKYLNEYRLYHAKKLITSTDLTISEICTDVGYNQVSYFIEQFREHYGMSPLKYRKKHCGES